MTTQLQFQVEGGAQSQTDRLIEMLHAANGEWVSLPDLVAGGCGYAVATRASNARKMGINIQNKVEYSQLTKLRHSWYRIIAP